MTTLNRNILSNVFVYLLILLSGVTLCTSVHAYDLEKQVEEYTLDNGLTVLVVERHFSPTVSLYIRFKAGAVDESSEHTGTAHFLEHMLFKGTPTIGTSNYQEEKKVLAALHNVIREFDREKRKGAMADTRKLDTLTAQLDTLQKEAKAYIRESEIDRLYTENGGANLNASTGYDLTSYHVNLPSNKIELWARIESDRMTHPVFREYFSERNVVIEERRQTIESRPDRKLMEQFLATAFMVHPYRRPIIGWASDMPFLNIDYMKHFFKTYHAPNNTVIAVVGDISAPDVHRLIVRYFGHIPPQELPPRAMSMEPPQEGERRVDYVADANPKVMIGYHKPTLPAFDDYVFDAMSTILSGGRTSRLYKTLVQEKGIARVVETINGFPAVRYPNLFVCAAQPRFPHTTGELEDALYDQIRALQEAPVHEKELEKAKNQMKADFLRRLASNAGLAGMLSYFEAVAGDFRYITNHINMIEKVTAADIQEAARHYLIPSNRTVATLTQKQDTQ